MNTFLFSDWIDSFTTHFLFLEEQSFMYIEYVVVRLRFLNTIFIEKNW